MKWAYYGIFFEASGILRYMRKNLLSICVLVLLLSTAAIAQRSKTDPLKVGEIAPDFSLTSDSGKTVALSAIQGPVVVVFYRAYW